MRKGRQGPRPSAFDKVVIDGDVLAETSPPSSPNPTNQPNTTPAQPNSNVYPIEDEKRFLNVTHIALHAGYQPKSKTRSGKTKPFAQDIEVWSDLGEMPPNSHHAYLEIVGKTVRIVDGERPKGRKPHLSPWGSMRATVRGTEFFGREPVEKTDQVIHVPGTVKRYMLKSDVTDQDLLRVPLPPSLEMKDVEISKAELVAYISALVTALSRGG
jgi:hypothetical protein